MVPVKDSITIKEGAQIKLFLDTNPLKSIDGSVVRFNYEPEKTAQGILSYRVLALINNNQITPRIGLRGTAKIYGQQVKLFFYLFRKPITTLRQFIGF